MKTNLNYQELKQGLKEVSATVHKAWEEAGETKDFSKVLIFGAGLSNADKVKKMTDLSAKLTEYHDDLKEYEALIAVRKTADDAVDFKGVPQDNPGKQAEMKSIGQMIKESGLLKDKSKSFFLPDVDMKTLFETAAGWAPMVQRLPGYVASPVRQPTALNFIPQYTTNQNSIKYMKETTYTATNAVEKAEGTALGEVVLALTETSDEVEKVGAFIPVTDVQLEDEPSVGQYLTDRLTLMVKNRIESQCLVGTGVTPLLLGTASLSSPNSQAKGADPTPDTIFKAMTLIRSVGFAEPSVIFMHPNDWQDIKLLRTADGIYIYGNPADAGPERMWGVPVCVTTAVTENTGLIGDYTNYAALYWRKGLEVAISSGYNTYFTEGKQAVRITARCAMVHTRDKAFALCTGI